MFDHTSQKHNKIFGHASDRDFCDSDEILELCLLDVAVQVNIKNKDVA